MSELNKYILLDAARMGEDILKAKDMNSDSRSLFQGKKDAKRLLNVAPQIFQFDDKPDFISWYFENGWGNSWGIIVYSSESIKSLQKHFQKFIDVITEDGKEYYLRFYDPRVLRVFLPTCDAQQLIEFFGPINYFICEDKDGISGLVFSIQDEILNIEKISKEDIILFIPKVKRKKFWFY